ncbi:FG-GAP-like repeat-containing protein [Cohnella sp. GCM10020058]|uniref:FG-GAP-like repeat-containing protein n=1 Tax=Cohnella sp. GCM10020058 TaxID=3317330 RepID=UPI0036446B98
MKRRFIAALGASSILLASGIVAPVGYASASAPSVGAWYSTWYAKKTTPNATWITGFGGASANRFVGDVTGDGKADAVIFNSDGSWQVAVSNGNGFNTPSVWTTGHGAGSSSQLLADVNGDGKQDALAFFGSSGNWYAALSNGTGFGGYSLWVSGLGAGSTTQLAGDVNGDGKADAVAYQSGTGAWSAALSTGSAFGTPAVWASSFGASTSRQFLGDANGDGKADAIAFDGTTGNWYRALSGGASFGASSLWTAGHGVGSQHQLVGDGNADGYADPFVVFNADVNGDALPGDWYARLYSKYAGALDGYDFVMNTGFGSGATAVMQGNVNGDPDGFKASVAFEASTGTWKVQPYHATKANEQDTWSAWNIRYKPLTLGAYQQYDSGTTAVIDEHLATLADAKVDFLLLDQTNNIYVDDGYIFKRSVKVAGRIAAWNAAGSHRTIKYANAIGGVQWSHDPAHIEWEAGEIWSQFNDTPSGGPANAFYLNGKPLLVIYCTPADRSAWESWTGSKTNTNRFTVRWAHSPSTAGTYGWEVRSGTLDDDEVMVVMPGWNNNKGATPVSRANGDYYALSGWEKVLRKSPKPQVVILNSFNEYGEETAVADADTGNLLSPSEKWYDKSGLIDNAMYWNMTKNYIGLLHTSSYQASALFSKGQGWYGWSYKQWNGSAYSDMTWNSAAGRWQGTQPYVLILADRQHPDTYDAVRAWTAPYAGTVTVSGTVRLESTGGDGIVAAVKKNGTTVWGPQTVTTTTGMAHSFTVSVAAGDVLYFIVNKNGTNSYDTTIWNPTIAY